MRPVTVNPNPTYQIPDEMTTRTVAIRNGLARNNIQPVRGQTIYDTEQVLALLQELTFDNDGDAGWSGLNRIDQALVVSLITFFTNNDNVKYGRARGSLIDNYGQYCGYCGLPVQDTALAVEHCLPKAEFPGEMLTYTNFFLACPSCNSFKGSKPTFNTSKEWAERLFDDPDYDDIKNGGYGRQLWPNSNHAFDGFPMCLYTVPNDNQIPIQNSININNELIGVVQNVVRARIQNYNNNNPVNVYAKVLLNDFNDQELREQEQNFIDIVQLNDYETNVYSDRRVTNRTVAWLNALASLRNLNQFQAGSPLWQAMVLQVFITAKSAGFFEVWAYLFYLISPPNVGANSIYTLFKNASTSPNQPYYYFPGTNAAQLPN